LIKHNITEIKHPTFFTELAFKIQAVFNEFYTAIFVGQPLDRHKAKQFKLRTYPSYEILLNEYSKLYSNELHDFQIWVEASITAGIMMTKFVHYRVFKFVTKNHGILRRGEGTPKLKNALQCLRGIINPKLLIPPTLL
jgi:hypothetical protein